VAGENVEKKMMVAVMIAVELIPGGVMSKADPPLDVVNLWADVSQIHVEDVNVSIEVARYVAVSYHDAGLEGIMVVDDLLRNSTLHIKNGYVVCAARREFAFPVKLMRGRPRPLRLDVVMFHAMLYRHEDETDAIYRCRLCESRVYANLLGVNIVGEAAGRREVTPQEEALLRASGFFWDLVGVSGMISVAATTGIPGVQVVVARASHLIGLMYGTCAEADTVVRSIVDTPWRVTSGTVFWAELENAIFSCSVPVRWVHLEAKAVSTREPLRPKSLAGEGHAAPVSIVLDNTVGLVITPGDKMTLALMLLFNEVHHHRIATVPDESTIPAVLLSVLKRYKRTLAEGVHSPWYYGTV
jgi:hypothetical protein